MNRQSLGISALAAFFAFALAATLVRAQPGTQPADQPLKPKPQTAIRVVVSIAPLRGLVEPLLSDAGIANTIEVLIPPGRSEHGYEIPPSKLAELESADMVVLVGLGLEPQVQKFLAKLPERPERPRRVVIFADAVGLKADAGEAEHHQDHDHDHHDAHGDEGEHHHGADPHIWLDPVLVEQLVPVLTDALAKTLSADAAAVANVRASGDKLAKRVHAVHENYTRTCGQFPTKTIVVGHDAWERLAARYGLETVAIAGLTASEPTPKALERAKAAVQEKRLKVVFVEPQLSDRAGRRIAEATGAEVRKLDPLGDGDWFALMAANLSELERALGPTPVTPAAAPAAGGDTAQPGKPDHPK